MITFNFELLVNRYLRKSGKTDVGAASSRDKKD